MTRLLVRLLHALGASLTAYGLARAGTNPDHLTHTTDPEQE